MLHVIAVISLLIHAFKSCSIIRPDDGTIYIKSLNLLDDPNSILLTIAESGSDISYCKVMDSNDGTVGAAQDCDDLTDSMRDDSEADVDSTSTSVVSVVNNNDGTLAITLKRNDQQITFNADYPSSIANLVPSYKIFTINSLKTTYMLLGARFGPLTIIGVEFKSLDYNEIDAIHSVIGTGDWRNVDISRSTPIKVYESVNAIKFPLVCCLCYGDFVAQYDIFTNPSYIFNLQTVQTGGFVDTEGAKSYKIGSFYGSDVNVYSFKDERRFGPDLTGNDQ